MLVCWLCWLLLRVRITALQKKKGEKKKDKKNQQTNILLLFLSFFSRGLRFGMLAASQH
jgi:hypothetical protein